MADSDVPGLTQVTPTLTGITYQVNDPNGGSEAEGYSTNQQLMDLFEANIAAPATAIASGTFADARVAESNVTQHQAALSITESQISDLGSYQPLDADLTAIAGLSSADGNVIVGSASGWVVESGATVRTSLGLAIGSDVQAWDADLDTWATKTPPSGDPVGTTDTQTLTGKSIDAGQLTGSIADARVPESAVTQHEAALAITESQISDLGAYLLPSDIASGTITARADDIDLSGGSDGDVLTVQADGSLALEAAAGGGSSPGGSDTQVQYNNGGAFGGDAGLTYDDVNKALTVGGATVTTSQPVLNLSQTWNAAGVTFEGMVLDITEASLASGSDFFAIKSGGATKWAFRKAGSLYDFILANGIDSIGGSWLLKAGGDTCAKVSSAPGSVGFLEIPSGGSLRFEGTSTGFNYDASGVIGQRGAVDTAQAQRWWNTFTDLSNGEYAHASWKEAANIFEIATKAVGTGTQRSMRITAGSANILMPDLPTSDPSVAGALWNDGGILTVSSG